jgi:hypothetical protein
MGPLRDPHIVVPTLYHLAEGDGANTPRKPDIFVVMVELFLELPVNFPPLFLVYLETA